MKLSKSAALFVVAILQGLPSAAAAQCNETDALLKVSYNDDAWDVWDNIIEHDPELIVRPSGTTGNSTMYEYAEYTRLVLDFELCVPREGSCLEVTIGLFPVDSYTISWDGEKVETGPKFPFGVSHITSTEVGDNCIPTCDSTEALFELKQWTAKDNFGPYRVEDEDGNTVLGCDGEDSCDIDSYQMYTDRACLSKDACHKFLIGDEHQSGPDSIGNVPSFSVRYDNKLLMKSDSGLFKSLPLGKCTPQGGSDTLTNNTPRRNDASPTGTTEPLIPRESALGMMAL